MSIIYCEKHDRRWDSDRLEMCPECENEPEKPDLLPKFYTPSQKCSQCGESIKYIEANGCPERCGRPAKTPATPRAMPIQPTSRSQFKRMTAQGAIDPELSEVDEAFNKWLDTTTGYGLSMRRILDRPYDHAPTFIAGYMAALKRRIEGEGK